MDKNKKKVKDALEDPTVKGMLGVIGDAFGKDVVEDAVGIAEGILEDDPDLLKGGSKKGLDKLKMTKFKGGD